MFNWMIAGYHLRKMPQISAPQPWICGLSHVPSSNVGIFKEQKYPCPRRHVPLLSTLSRKNTYTFRTPSHPGRERTCPKHLQKLKQYKSKGCDSWQRTLELDSWPVFLLSWLLQSSWLRWNTAKCSGSVVMIWLICLNTSLHPNLFSDLNIWSCSYRNHSTDKEVYLDQFSLYLQGSSCIPGIG